MVTKHCFLEGFMVCVCFPVSLNHDTTLAFRRLGCIINFIGPVSFLLLSLTFVIIVIRVYVSSNTSRTLCSSQSRQLSS